MNLRIKTQGFTLIELMMAVVIIAIITIIGSNVYSSYVRKGRRIDAINSLLSISLAEERYRTTHTLYGTLAQAWSGVSASNEGYYTLSISNVSASSYTITATANGNQSNDAVNGTSCATLTLAVSNGTITKTPSVCWPT
jgi:type IV pilus assembly protein PilE